MRERRKLKRVLMGRLLIFLFAIAIQFIWLVWLMYHFSNLTYFLPLIEFLSLIVLFIIINRKINSAYKLIWAVLVLAFPLVGLTLYLIFGHYWWNSSARKRLSETHGSLIAQLPQNNEVLTELKAIDLARANQSVYISKYSDYPLYRNTDTKYFKSGEAIFESILNEMQEAEHFIFLEFFIIAEGKLLQRLLNLLEQKVSEGVDVRFIYDDAGSITTVQKDFYLEAQKRGIKCVKFNPMRPILSLLMNNRDHRKIVIIDGYIGYTGGMNVGDEYTNELYRLGYWKDTGLRIEGEAVSSLTSMFLEMWNYITCTNDSFECYKPQAYKKSQFKGNGFIQPFGDTPLDEENVSSIVYMNIIGNAEKYVYIFTPYLILDDEMIVQLQNAAKRGVDVRIVLPDIPDKKLIFLMSQSYYQSLLEAGVKIYQYVPGFMHAKSFLSDDKVAIVGTANLDFRSLYLHFECGIWMYQTSVIDLIKEDYEEVFTNSKEIDAQFISHFSPIVIIFQSILRLFAPLV